MFHVGQLVVCVDDQPKAGKTYDMDGLRKGGVYTVREILVRTKTGVPGIRLDEIVRAPCPVTGEADIPYARWRFKPIAKTDISIFQAMLSPTKVSA